MTASMNRSERAKRCGRCALSAVVVACWLSGTAVAEIPPHQARQIEDAAPKTASVKPKKSRRVLVFLTPPQLMTQDPHKGYCIPYGAYALQTLGKKTGSYETVISDDLAMFLPEQISQFDAIVLNNTSGPWITPTQQQLENESFHVHGSDVAAVEAVLRNSLLGYMRNGGGLLAIHYAIGGNRHWPAFAELLGANYNGHPWNEEVTIQLDDPDHPVIAAFAGKECRLAEEIFQFRSPYTRDRVRVLLSLNTKQTNMGVPWIDRDDHDFALAWVRAEGKGRVCYSAIGHRTEHYWNPMLLKFYLATVQFCTGDLPGATEPQTSPSGVPHATR